MMMTVKAATMTDQGATIVRVAAMIVGIADVMMREVTTAATIPEVMTVGINQEAMTAGIIREVTTVEIGRRAMMMKEAMIVATIPEAMTVGINQEATTAETGPKAMMTKAVMTAATNLEDTLTRGAIFWMKLATVTNKSRILQKIFLLSDWNCNPRTTTVQDHDQIDTFEWVDSFRLLHGHGCQRGVPSQYRKRLSW